MYLSLSVKLNNLNETIELNSLKNNFHQMNTIVLKIIRHDHFLKYRSNSYLCHKIHTKYD
jgi:hypothetical protein